ncbi:MAG: hypothetical protein ISR58_04180 [Anaerolineales bacterium]|nr:hypothetical protein [Chloroflexota bacterium]MBL6980371.1 hypothetical protein [Anaerolineales bacterium]
MNKQHETQPYERKVTGAERFFSHAPFSTVTMVARIKGKVTEEMLKRAIEKVQQRHALLRVRIEDNQKGELWFTSEGAQEIPIEVVPRKSEHDWIQIHAEGAKIPYDFETRPAIRFNLVQSPEVSELIILCHHIICDGMSLAYLARDLMIHLGDPAAEARVLPTPEPISLDNLPKDVSPSGLIMYFVNKIKQKWADEIVYFDQEDYVALNKAYWENFNHEILSIELSEAETSALVTRSRKENVTVNSAIITAFSGAQKYVVSEQPHHAKTVSAVSLRDRLPKHPGEGIGYYALGLEVKYKYNTNKSFWDNARKYHKKIISKISNKKVFGDLPIFLEMDSNVYEALSFKKLGSFVMPDSPRYKKLHNFSEREDMVVGLLKRAKMETLDAKLIGPAITNLGRLDFPKKYGALELDRLIMQPGGAFPLVHVDMVIGAVTCAGKLSLVVEYAEEAIDTATMKVIKAKAMELLQNNKDGDYA